MTKTELVAEQKNRKNRDAKTSGLGEQKEGDYVSSERPKPKQSNMNKRVTQTKLSTQH